MPRFPLARNLVVYAIFAASGASALIYQVLWSRWLSLSFGSTTASVSIVLACFMMGLALGSAAAGRFMRRITNPLRVYAAMEFGIAVFAVFFPLLLSFTDSIFPLIVSPSSSVFYSLTMRALLALLLLIAPTSMMGATLPLLAEFFRRNPRQTTSFKVGVLYAANTLGAALGILASSFFLIELVGVFTTTMIAASLNLFVAAMGYHYSRSAAKMPPPSKEAGRAIANEPAFMVKLATAVLAASGAVAMASEVLWTRALETVMGNSAYAFATIVCVYLVGIALGSWLMAMVVHRLRRQYPFWLAALQLTMGAWLLISIVIIQKISEALLQHNAQMAAITSHLLVYLQVTLVLMPLSLASGACFPLAARMIEPDAEDPKGESIGRAYSWNTVGGVIGSLLAGFLIAPHFDSFDALYLIALAYGIIALMVLTTTAWRERPARRDRAEWVSMSALILLVIASALYSMTGDSYFIRHFAPRPENPSPEFVVLFHKPGLQGVVTAGRQMVPNGPLLFSRDFLLLNGSGMTCKATETKMMAHLPLLMHPDPKDTLVICFGMGTTHRSALSHGGNVTVVELAQEVVSAFPFFHADAARVLANPKGRIIVNDGRNFLKLTREKFDVITIDPPPPIDAAGVVNLYSKDFLELAKSRLKKGGILTHWYPFPGTGSGVDDEASYNGLIGTFAHTFPYVYVKRSYHEIGLHLMGTSEPLTISSSEVTKRLGNPEVARDIKEWDPVPASYFSGMPLMPALPLKMPLLTDDNPWLEFHLLLTLRTGGQKMFPKRWW